MHDDHRGQQRSPRARLRAAPVHSSTSCSRPTARRAPSRPRCSPRWSGSARTGSPTPGAAATRSSCSRGSRSRRPARTARRASARSRSTSSRGSSRRGVAHDQARPRAAHPRAEPLRRRRLPRARDRARRASCRGASSSDAAHFARAVHGIRPPGGVYCHVAGCDLVRDSDGTWKVLEDNVRTPSGISYVLENRVAMTRLVPELFAPTACGRSTTTRSSCSPRCARSRRRADSEATVVVWTPGPINSAYFEHAFLARQMGVELVEASRPRRARRRPLHAHDARPRARPRGLPPARRRLRRPARVPPRLAARRAGLVRAYRAGTVAIANAIGTGVADDKAIYHYVPEMIRFYLGEEPLLAERADVPAGRHRAARARARSGSTSSSSSRRASPAARACSSARWRRDAELARAGGRRSARTRSAGSPRRS